jgi:hypothetical protein
MFMYASKTTRFWTAQAVSFGVFISLFEENRKSNICDEIPDLALRIWPEGEQQESESHVYQPIADTLAVA